MSDPQARPDPAFALLDVYDAALPQVYGYLLARCGNRAQAEELTSETFLAAVQSARTGGPVSPAWLIGIARHKLVDHWRRREREERGLRLAHTEPDVEDPWDEHIDAIQARDTLAGLSRTHRCVLTLRYVDGLPVPEVAELIGRTVHATEALLVRARAAFRRAYPGGRHE
ncbi:sigma-70 family RNA polymerase sigma factor [Saccharothrix sp. NPDC042600]|uniref:RNA polymerase sigma factor n=1 Tax=Saccharothrix TaxID=2071 RepID=UPI0033F24DB0|nr:sigma-70 family RNA polymerase sigma factor [Saccharothrix mutabilis subsp. capreolus]